MPCIILIQIFMDKNLKIILYLASSIFNPIYPKQTLTHSGDTNQFKRFIKHNGATQEQGD